MSYLIIDADYLAYTVASVFQETYILATHPELKEPIRVKNKTELWGEWRKKKGGWIAEYNSRFFANLKPEDFTLVEYQEPLCIKAAKKSLDTRLQGLLEETGASSYKGFVGRGDTFRSSLATLLEYKGNRSASRPVHLTELKQYLVDKHKCRWVEEVETDDAVTSSGFAAYKKWKESGKESDKGIIVFADKDLVQTDSWQYHVGQNSKPELRVGLGSIYRDDSGKVRGFGRKHFYWQVMTSDLSDNFSASCFSDIKWGDIKGFDLLVECKTDKECLEALVKGFKYLYPEPKTIVGWRGDSINIDWLYVLTECFNLAKMLRTLDEQPTNVKETLDKLKIAY